jgi:hypothetical protein
MSRLALAELMTAEQAKSKRIRATRVEKEMRFLKIILTLICG